MDTNKIHVVTLGRLEIRPAKGGTPRLASQPKRAALLAYLAAAEPRGPQRRDKLLAAFWPELNQTKARRALSQALHTIRKELGIELFENRGDQDVGLDWGKVSCDVVEVRETLASGRSEAAVALYPGEFLSGFHLSGALDFERWADNTRARLHDQVSEAAWSLAEAQPDPGRAVRLASQAAAFSPHDEGVARRLIAFYLDRNERVGALEYYQDFAARLAQDYQLEPAPETRALVDGIDRSAESSVSMVRAARPPNVDKGLGAPVRTLPAARRTWAMGAALVLTAIVLVAIMMSRPTPPPPIPNSYIVFPFTVTAGDTTLAWLSRGSAAMLAHDLDAWADVRTVDPRRLRAIAESLDVVVDAEIALADARAIAKAARAETMVFGDIVGREHEVEIAVRRFDVASGAPLEDFLRVSGDLTEDLRRPHDQLAAMVLGLDVKSAETIDLRTATTPSIDAYRAYLSGLQHFRNWELPAAIRNFETAIEHDSTFAQALYRLAVTHDWLPGANPEVNVSNRETLCDLMRRASEYSGDVAGSALHHIHAFTAYACGDDMQLARELYNELVAADSSDAEAWFHLGNVEMADEDVVKNAEGDWVPRANFWSAVKSYGRAVALDPLFHLGYGHAFYLLGNVNSTGYDFFDVPPDSRARPDQNLEHVYFYLARTGDSIAFIPVDPDDPGLVINPRYNSPEGRAVRDSAVAVAQRWEAAAPNLAAPHAALRDLYLDLKEYPLALDHERSRYDLADPSEHAPGPAGVTPEDMHNGYMAVLHLAAGNFDSAATYASPMATLRQDEGRPPPLSIINVLAALGRPTAAWDTAMHPQFYLGNFIPVADSESIDITSSWRTRAQIQLFGAAGVYNDRVAAALNTLDSLWSSYSRDERGLLHLVEAKQVIPALLLRGNAGVESWFATATALDSMANDRVRRNHLLWEPLRQLERGSAHGAAAALEAIGDRLDGPAWDVRATERYVLGIVAQQIGRHELAIHLLESVQDGLGHLGFVAKLEPLWPLAVRSYLDRARSYEALGRSRDALNAYRTFLAAWQYAEPEAQYLADEARQAVDRLAGSE